jgi:hypothetical protein
MTPLFWIDVAESSFMREMRPIDLSTHSIANGGKRADWATHWKTYWALEQRNYNPFCVILEVGKASTMQALRI